VFAVSGYASLREIADIRKVQVNVYASARSHTHKHADNGAITLWVDGREWLIDPGMYAYGVDDEFGDHYRSAAAHNTLELHEAGDFRYGANPTSIAGRDLGGDSPSVDVWNRAYPFAAVRRTVTWSRRDHRLYLRDVVETDHPGVVAFAHFHFGPNIRAAAHDGLIECVDPAGNRMRIELRSGAQAVEIRSGAMTPAVAGWRYFGAMRREPIDTARISLGAGVDRLECAIDLP
jgi:hypothetical protein